MRVTICELPHEPKTLELSWRALSHHIAVGGGELLLLPELAMVEPLWERTTFDPARWAMAEELGAHCVARLGELNAKYVVGTRAATSDGRHFNEGFLWTAQGGAIPLRRKYFLPDEPGGWEANWFDRGDREFPVYRVDQMSFGLNVCTELWALETYAEYAERSVDLILTPRATARSTQSKWLAAGTVAAVRSGAFSVSSNRVEPSGECGGGGWVISPDGVLLALTTPEAPFATVEIDLAESAHSAASYPRYVFRSGVVESVG
jgi:N-carbamoylputrescine amidase